MKRLVQISFHAATLLLFGACASPKPEALEYNVKALRPRDPGAVRVKVSLSSQTVYVMEGERLLMVAATCVGLPEKPTPRGQFRIQGKIAEKRSNSYGFFVNGGGIMPGEAAHPKDGRFVGYPMPYWCEFAPGYGFHAGYVHPVPRTHGCLRLHQTVAPKFFALVKEGTPVSIAQDQPEDAALGSGVARPTDYRDPDPPAAFMISQRVFVQPTGPLLNDM
ncbi:MAG: D-transpeptidase catalytic domain [Verrucomicrobia bacterium]|nr:MAG: D-transpeptidase catalytic domain [Verrucomicrobiota bacterium]